MNTLKNYIASRSGRIALGLLALVIALLTDHAGHATPLLLGMGTTDLADITTVDSPDVQEGFKKVYAKMVDAIPDSTPLTAQLQRTTKFKPGGDGEISFAVKLETGGKVANVGDSRLLPKPGAPRRKKGRAGIAHTYTVIAVGGQTIALTQDRKGSFVNELEDQLEDGMIRVRNDVERQYNGDGRGILCVVETLPTAGAPNTYGVMNPFGRANAGPGIMNLIEDMDVAFINPAGGLERGRTTITSINVDADTFNGTAVAGVALGDYIVICNGVGVAGTDAENNYLSEATGILALCNRNDTFQDISGAAFRRWNAQVMGNAGVLRPVTERLVSTLRKRIKTGSGRKPTLDYTTGGIILDLAEDLSTRIRYSGETTTLPGGYEAAKMHGRVVVEGEWCAKGHYFSLNTEPDVAGMLDLVKMGYIDLDGAKLHRTEGRHAFRADLWFPHNAIWHVRNCHGVLHDLNDDYSIVR